VAVKAPGPSVVLSVPTTLKICLPHGVCCETGVIVPPVKTPATWAPVELVSANEPPGLIVQLVDEPKGQSDSGSWTTLAFQKAASKLDPSPDPANVLVLFVGIDVSAPAMA
jgi:hypothetical protein